MLWKLPPRPRDWVPPPMPKRHGPLAAVVGRVFEELRVGVSLWLYEAYWHVIHAEPTFSRFEDETGLWQRRWTYNDRCLARAVREQRLVRGDRLGFRDLFVPVLDGERVDGVLVAGPLSAVEPSADRVLEQWHDVSAAPGHLGDSTFSRYVSAALEALTLDGPLMDAFERLMTCYAAILGGQGSADVLATQAARLREQLLVARLPERMWDVARRLVDDRAARPAAPLDHGDMAAVGLERAPAHAIVGVVPGLRGDPDRLDGVIRLAALQRAAARLARRHGGVVCGQVGDHGVALLVDARGTPARVRARLLDLGARLAATARRLGLRLHAGISRTDDTTPLPARYRSALWAAEKALAQGTAVVHADPRPSAPTAQLRELRAELGSTTAEPARLLIPRFHRYIEGVVAHTGHRLDLTGTELEVGLERLVEPLCAAGFLDARSRADLFASLERKRDDAQTVTELLAAYRQAVADVQAMVENPTAARHDRGTRRAVDYIRDHLGDRLSIETVARVAGFAPDYFARIFKREQGTSLGRYMKGLRVERAKQLLSGTAMRVEQIRRLSGYRTRTHFHRAFKEATGVTPTEFRKKKRWRPRPR